VFEWFCGRSTFFAVVLLLLGTSLALAHRLDASYVALASVIQTLVTARAISGDRAPGDAK
jgi:hypothetical protein